MWRVAGAGSRRVGGVRVVGGVREDVCPDGDGARKGVVVDALLLGGVEERAEARVVVAVREEEQQALAKLERGRELLPQLPHRVQEQDEHGAEVLFAASVDPSFLAVAS